MLVENFTDVGIREYLFGFGEVSIAPGEVKELPDAVVALWTDPKRRRYVYVNTCHPLSLNLYRSLIASLSKTTLKKLKKSKVLKNPSTSHADV